MKAGKFREYKEINYPELAGSILKFWDNHKIFERSFESEDKKPVFTFYEGPPSANGTPGIHHVISRAVKDIFCRYKTLKGYQVKRKGGWDTHGLPVELEVEKELGITKEDIGKSISIEAYNSRCREAVMRYKDQWDLLTRKMGYWLDLSDPYITFETNYIESVWSLLKELYDENLLYKGYTIQPYSPAAGSGLSSHELNMPGTYREVKDISIVAQFKLSGTMNDYFLAWTTTPWTLPANSALAVGENIDYAKVRTYNRYTHEEINVILAEDLVDVYFEREGKDLPFEEYDPESKKIPWEVTNRLKGKELIGREYDQLLPYVPLPRPAFTVVPGDFVTTEEGTGIVHISKTFGADDYRTCVKYNIPGVMVEDEEGNDVPIVDKKGRFVKEITDFAGMYVKNYTDEDENDPDYESTDLKIAMKLKGEGKAFKIEKHVHSYPHCWRTDKPVLYYPLDSWFIKTTDYKQRLVELNNTINWKPPNTGTGRFGNWLENLIDWNLSRSRYWGTPLPIWTTEDGSEQKCIGSLKELNDEIQASIKAGIMKEHPFERLGKVDLHRPWVDEVDLVGKNKKKMYRESDLIDVWFDSGAMPYAQYHYPFENQEIFKENFPADFIAEGVDQTRGWFFTLHAIAGLLYDSVAFKNVISNGLVLDKDGNKMSKRLGNAVDPFEILDKYGPDATRWYMISNANPWDNMKFNPEGIAEVQRRFFGTLQNTYSFFALYANIDGFSFREKDVDKGNLTESDRWILSKLNTLIKETEEAYEDYEPTKVARKIQEFVIKDLSNWYVRLNRKRFWKGEYNHDKDGAYQTLYTCLINISKLSSPIAPFYMDQLYQDLNRVTGLETSDSIHLSNFPEIDHSIIDKELEIRMKLAQDISSLVHSLRKNHGIKVRQPLAKILIPVVDKDFKRHIRKVEDIILTEVNAKRMEYIEDTTGVVTRNAKPNFRKLGQEYGPKVKEIASKIRDFGDDEITALERGDVVKVQIENQEIKLSIDDVEITSHDIPGWSVASEGSITVALDLTITDELRQEGVARDIVNRIQNIRKDMGLEVQDKIKIFYDHDNSLLDHAFQNFKKYICQETQALELAKNRAMNGAREFDIDGMKVKIRIEK